MVPYDSNGDEYSDCICQPLPSLTLSCCFYLSELLRKLITERDELVEEVDTLKDTLRVNCYSAQYFHL